MADIDPGDPQDTVSPTVAGSVAASSARQADRADSAGEPMSLPDVPAALSKRTGPVS